MAQEGKRKVILPGRMEFFSCSEAVEKCDFVVRADWHTVIAQLDPLGSPVKFFL